MKAAPWGGDCPLLGPLGQIEQQQPSPLPPGEQTQPLESTPAQELLAHNGASSKAYTGRDMPSYLIGVSVA